MTTTATGLHFLTFGDGSARIRGAARRLGRQAAAADVFGTIRCYDLQSLQSEFPGFCAQHLAFIRSNRRGLGYWIWKPFLVQQRLAAIPENDVLVYADAGCEFTGCDRQVMQSIFTPSTDRDIKAIVLEAAHTARRWTAQACLSRMPDSAKYLDMPQICATFLFLRNVPRTRAFVDEWLRHCAMDDYGLLIGTAGPSEDSAFVEHRHDQAILNLLMRWMGDQGRLDYELLPVEATNAPTFPILGLRNLSPVSCLSGNRITRRLALGIFDLAARLFRW